MYLLGLGNSPATYIMEHIILIALQIVSVRSFHKQANQYYRPYLPDIEYEHAAVMYTTERPREINGSDSVVMDPYFTPDFRIEEPPYTRFSRYMFLEEERPYRVSPHYKQMRGFIGSYGAVGCTCCTVYKKLIPLATCAVITSRHILTTATSTELILRRYRHYKWLQGILGFWYDTDTNTYNSSLYAHPARIHYHPKYIRPTMVNRTHPFPVIFDLAVWAATYRFYTSYFGSEVRICPRAGSHRYEHSSAVPIPNSGKEYMSLITGYQFMKAYKRVPMPWFKYMVQTKKSVYPCPKADWGWLHCVRGNWAPLGLDSGANLFRIINHGWRYNGLMGMNVISMRLRYPNMMHYFQVLESHAVINFLYDAYMGYFANEWLDERFYDTRGRSPRPKQDKYIYMNKYEWGQDRFYGEIPNY